MPKATTVVLVLLICFAVFVSYWPLVHQLRVAEPVLMFSGQTPEWKPASGLPKLSGRKQVMWLHMHKFGGTFMTKMAGLQGEVFPPGNINANWMPDFCSTPQGQRILCVERSAGTKSADISWSAMERELDEGDFCDGALIGTMLREPLSALQSVLSHDRFDKVSILDTLRSCSEQAPAVHFMYQPPSLENKSSVPACLPAWDTYQHFDNFATRVLAGAYAQPPCSINFSHLDAAKSQLRRMDVLTILEHLGEHLPQLQDIFHWNVTSVQPGKIVNRKPKRYVNNSTEFTPPEMQFLKEVNAIDLALYEFAIELARTMTVRAQDSIGKRGDALLPAGGLSDSAMRTFVLRQRVASRREARLRGASH